MLINDLRKRYPLKACLKVLHITRNMYYYWKDKVLLPDKDSFLISRIKGIVSEFPFYGFPKVFHILKKEGFISNHKKVRRIYRLLALQRPLRSKRSRRLCEDSFAKQLTTATHSNHVWAADFLKSHLSSGRAFRAFICVDIFSRDIVTYKLDYSLPATEVIDALNKGFDDYGKPMFFRTDNGPEFRSKATARFVNNDRGIHEFIDKGKPYQNGYAESLVDKLKDELFNRFSFDTIEDARERFAEHILFFNTRRPHSGIGYKTPQEVRNNQSYSLLMHV